MKELSIEDKAKLYDEAYKKVSIRFGSNVADEIFPELKESEDKRIRNFLMMIVDKYAGVSNEEKKKCLTWLKKQGKNNMGISEATKQKLEDNLNKALEQETPYSWNDFLKGEQKSTWSEEDEKILSDIIKDLVHPWNEYIPDRIEDEIKWLKNRLKSLKDKVQSQREWNEEDKEQLDRALYMMEQLDMTKSWDDVYNWLKSLRPQNTWKPSKEQMQALSDAGNSFRPFEEGHKVLWSLYNDLKKLKEE